MNQNDVTAANSRDKDGYAEFAFGIRFRFKDFQGPLFTTNVPGQVLWDAFLSNLPAEGRQHYNCNCCRHFVTRLVGWCMSMTKASRYRRSGNEINRRFSKSQWLPCRN